MLDHRGPLSPASSVGAMGALAAGAAPCHGSVAAERGDGTAPALVDGRVDQADVGFDAAAAARDLADRRPGGRRAPRSLRPSRRRSAARSSGWTRRTMWRALSSSASSACSATCADAFGPRLQLAAQRPGARAPSPSRASARAISCCSASSCSPIERHEGADLRRRLAGEALLEAFERDQAVAVAVLVARLARGAQLLRVQLRRDRSAPRLRAATARRRRGAPRRRRTTTTRTS